MADCLFDGPPPADTTGSGGGLGEVALQAADSASAAWPPTGDLSRPVYLRSGEAVGVGLCVRGIVKAEGDVIGLELSLNNLSLDSP